MEDLELITLSFDDGDVECEILGVFDFEDKDYIALLPNDGSEDVYIYGYTEIDEETFNLDDIEDDALFERVAAEFERIMNSDDEEDGEEE